MCRQICTSERAEREKWLGKSAIRNLEGIYIGKRRRRVPIGKSLVNRPTCQEISHLL
jgi:hypothetical protein